MPSSRSDFQQDQTVTDKERPQRPSNHDRKLSVRRPHPSHQDARSHKLARGVNHLEGEVMHLGPVGLPPEYGARLHRARQEAATWLMRTGVIHPIPVPSMDQRDLRKGWLAQRSTVDL